MHMCSVTAIVLTNCAGYLIDKEKRKFLFYFSRILN